MLSFWHPKQDHQKQSCPCQQQTKLENILRLRTHFNRGDKNRWHVELFFKWIKQHLCVKRFFGRSDNAVRSQIWIAMCVYLLILKLKKRRELNYSAYEILQILSVPTFNKIPLFAMFLNENTLFNNRYNPNQLLLFDL